MNYKQRKVVRVLFDEYHSETWSASISRAAEIQPKRPANSSYSEAANVLALRDFVVKRNFSSPLTPQKLEQGDVVVLLHPCDPRWEYTTSTHSPVLDSHEIQALDNTCLTGVAWSF